ncbi:hypothetical protein F2Q69_00054935 [Brassica cretica]|uniref:Uncharacterized protein n=1 Tax=Brassica cretica TaxID=69181 RepID=A0A8S9MVU1_BRACR|nr:hypothetical protein F2Q69_00054935 [Brassica cretica]
MRGCRFGYALIAIKLSSLSLESSLPQKGKANRRRRLEAATNSNGGFLIDEITDISLRRSAVVASAITGASETVKVSDLRGNEIPISDLWKDRKAVVAFARHFGC